MTLRGGFEGGVGRKTEGYSFFIRAAGSWLRDTFERKFVGI